MASKSVRFAVIKNGRPRCVLTVAENSRGDLTLGLRANPIGRPSDDPKGRVAVLDYRYSVHVSPESKLGVNTIMLTRVLANGDTLRGVHYAVGIKSGDGFAPIYGNRCDNLDGAWHDIKKAIRNLVSLGEIEDLLSLVFMVSVGPRDRAFNLIAGHNYDFKQVKFREFSIVILWSFLSIYAHPSGSMTHILTEGGPAPVLGETDIVRRFYFVRERLRRTFINNLRSEPGYETIWPLAERSKFFKSGVASDAKFQAWLRMLPPLREQPK